MRTAVQPSHGEVRDALDQAWWPFLGHALPRDVVVPLPNAPGATKAFLDLGLEGLILTGGDDLGARPERDQAEGSLLAICLDRRLPVLGVCRGLQFLSVHAGAGALSRCDPAVHRATRHVLRTGAHPLPPGMEPEPVTNSYHDFGVSLSPDSPLRPFAWSEDGCVEGAWDPSRRLLGIGWHPEREPAPVPMDVNLFRSHFHQEPR